MQQGFILKKHFEILPCLPGLAKKWSKNFFCLRRKCLFPFFPPKFFFYFWLVRSPNKRCHISYSPPPPPVIILARSGYIQPAAYFPLSLSIIVLPHTQKKTSPLPKKKKKSSKNKKKNQGKVIISGACTKWQLHYSNLSKKKQRKKKVMFSEEHSRLHRSKIFKKKKQNKNLVHHRTPIHHIFQDT